MSAIIANFPSKSDFDKSAIRESGYYMIEGVLHWIDVDDYDANSSMIQYK